MEVHVIPGEAPRLAEAADLRRFSVIVAAQPEALPALAAAHGGMLDFEGSGHAWVSVEWLIAASGLADSPDWRAGFEAMKAYAEGKGWTRSDPPALRGHVIWQGA
ncbi:hypothetical protein GXW74_07195 [Roseomonas eburnea]|uniref:Uncharacterized protein n=1 Tax=Neoroseomonas eburnea TaxID=1346889 RepID=A0A9X9X980_9PROT|nr:hypothetical protein [Neoroseomonas eburnea]MBR0680266.1 hypothetical protein [Neoroseomonas eburnea]